MKTLTLLVIALAIFTPAYASDTSKEAPVEHLVIPDVTPIDEATLIFIEKTSELKSKKKLDENELHQIHIITYTLEKSIEYFALNLASEQQYLSKKIANVVEDIHLNSENNRKEETQQQLQKYFLLAEQLAPEL